MHLQFEDVSRHTSRYALETSITAVHVRPVAGADRWTCGDDRDRAERKDDDVEEEAKESHCDDAPGSNEHQSSTGMDSETKEQRANGEHE